jgi:hypothetical protein
LGSPNVNTVWANNTVQGNSDGSSTLMAEDSTSGDQNVGTLKVYNMIVIGSNWPGFINNGGGGPVSQSNNLFMNSTGVDMGPDFLLQPGSNAINAGTSNVSGLIFTNDCTMKPLSYCGTKPDIGARESNF